MKIIKVKGVAIIWGAPRPPEAMKVDYFITVKWPGSGVAIWPLNRPPLLDLGHRDLS